MGKRSFSVELQHRSGLSFDIMLRVNGDPVVTSRSVVSNGGQIDRAVIAWEGKFDIDKQVLDRLADEAKKEFHKGCHKRVP